MDKIQILSEKAQHIFGGIGFKTMAVMGIRPTDKDHDNFYINIYSEEGSIEVEICSIAWISNLDPDNQFIECYTHENYEEIATDFGDYRAYRRG